MSDWQEIHRVVICDFLEELNKENCCFVLKGGTALMICYGLDRFSVDIDLDWRKGDIFEVADSFCEKKGFKYRIAKNTDTVKRIMLNYGNEGRPLKIEVSLRRTFIADDEITMINGITVYKIEQLSIMKANALSARDRVRDLYDIAFICRNYYNCLTPPAQFAIRNAVENKGFEYFDYIISQDKDELIDTSKLGNDFLDMYERLGLFYDR